MSESMWADVLAENERLRAQVARVEALADSLHEVAYSQIALEVMLTVLPLGPNRAQVPPHWRDEADKRALPYVRELRAALDGTQPDPALGRPDHGYGVTP